MMFFLSTHSKAGRARNPKDLIDGSGLIGRVHRPPRVRANYVIGFLDSVGNASVPARSVEWAGQETRQPDHPVVHIKRIPKWRPC
jgi:hypothetical protein